LLGDGRHSFAGFFGGAPWKPSILSNPMHPSQQEQAIFADALPLAAGERRAFVQSTCGADHALCHRVEALLHAYDEASSFMESLLARSPNQPLEADEIGERIGRYRILEKLGEGGCGVVYLAKQEEPVQRQVALKVIKLGMDTRQVVARFQAERQTLALMDHPNIARVFDAGATETGRPFFVMEVAAGMKITDYCDKLELCVTDRLQLFLQVCRGIQHAHQKGVIHRDLKPSNILITVHDGAPTPKVIDFGIAKATQGRLTELSVVTVAGQFMGTPAYMSPEQANGITSAIDTRTDVYGLGAVLYELVAGVPPVDTPCSLGMEQLLWTICEQEAARPSERLAGLQHSQRELVCRRRRCEPSGLASRLRGDLNWICLKAIEKQPDLRYQTANELARDIERHLAHEPVSASPPSKLLRLQKFVRRNRLPCVAAAVALISVFAGLSLSTFFLLRDKRAREREAIVRAEKERLRNRVEDVTHRYRASATAMDRMLVQRSPGMAKGQGGKYTREQLDHAVEQEKNIPTPTWNSQSGIRLALARSYSDLGDDTKAIEHAREALRLARNFFDDRSALFPYLSAMAELSRRTGCPQEAEAYECEMRTLTRQTTSNRPQVVCTSLHHAALYFIQCQRSAEGEEFFQNLLAEHEEAHGKDDPTASEVWGAMAMIYIGQGVFSKAEAAARKSLELNARREPSNLQQRERGLLFLSLASALQGQDKMVEAEAAFRQSLTTREKAVGADHVETVESVLLLAHFLSKAERRVEAESFYRRVLRGEEKNGCGKATYFQDASECLTRDLYQQQRFSEAKEIVRNAASTKGAHKEEAEYQAGRWLGTAHARHRRFGEAIDEVRDLLRMRPNDVEISHWLAVLLFGSGDMEAYRQHCQESAEKFWASKDPIVAERICKDALIDAANGIDPARIERMAETAASAPQHPAVRWLKLAKGLADYRLGKSASAVESLQGDPSAPDETAERLVEYNAVLAMAKFRLGDVSGAWECLRTADAVAETKLAKPDAADLGPNWIDNIIGNALRREAHLLLEEK
jgi:serine/threonine protein kinase